MQIDLTLPTFPQSGLTVRQFDIVEALSTPFEVALVCMSADADLDLEKIVAQPASLHIANDAQVSRRWTGVCSYVEQIEAEPAGESTYAIRIVPRLWLLSERRNHRVFQHQTAVEMVKKVLAEWQVDVDVRVTEANLARHETRVQYGESDLDFVSRLLEEAGVSYWFDDANDSRLVLADAPERAETRRAGVPFTSQENATTRGTPFAADVEVAHETRTGIMTIADFDFRRPRFPVVYHAEQKGAGEDRLERYTYLPGSGLADVAPSSVQTNDTPVADAQSFARIDEHQGYALAERRLAALREDRRRVQLSTNLLDLSPGAIFTIAGSPRPELASDQRLLVLQTNIDGKRDSVWTVKVAAAFASAAVRPPRRVAWPRIDGVQSAVVVGPTGEEIAVDEFGRVRVQFHWDREGKYDDHAFAWVRVCEGWGGAGFGVVTLPRVGQEVLVAFTEGNPDQPVIVGRLFGGSNPVPNGLPAGKTQTVWRTRSSPASSGFHELSFDDTAGREKVFLRSERDLEKVVVAAETEETDVDRTMVVAHNLGATVGAVDATRVGQMHEVRMATVPASRVDDAAPPNVVQLDTRREIIPKRITLTTGGATIMLDGPNIVVTAQHQVSFKAGGTVYVNGQPTVQINPPLVTRKADAAKPPPPPESTLWFRLVSEGQAMVGALVHLVHADGSTSGPLTTDGRGQVRVPASQGQSAQIKLGPPPKKEADTKAAAPVAQFSQSQAAPAPAPAPAQAKPAVAVGSTPAQATPKARPTDHVVPIAVQIVEPAAGATFEIEPGTYPGPAPSMPTVTLKAKVLVQGQETTTGSVRWEFSMSGKYRVRDHAVKGNYRLQDFKFAAGTATTLPNEEKKVQLAPQELVGGDLQIKAVYQGGPDLGNATATKVLTGLKVVGKNGPRIDVEKYIVDQSGDLAWLFLRMFCHESDHTLAQFKSAQPRYGPPSGVGIAQQDPEEGEWVWPKDRITAPSNFFPRIFWDWRKNVVSGMQHFLDTKVPTARRIVANMRKAHPGLPQPPEGLILRAAIRAYNGGRELAASDDGKHWIVSPQTIPANVGYVEWVLGDPHGTLAPQHPVPDDVKLKQYPAK
jgi:type VI secretion system secreted protein VgrG